MGAETSSHAPPTSQGPSASLAPGPTQDHGPPLSPWEGFEPRAPPRQPATALPAPARGNRPPVPSPPRPAGAADDADLGLGPHSASPSPSSPLFTASDRLGSASSGTAAVAARRAGPAARTSHSTPPAARLGAPRRPCTYTGARGRERGRGGSTSTRACSIPGPRLVGAAEGGATGEWRSGEMVRGRRRDEGPGWKACGTMGAGQGAAKAEAWARGHLLRQGSTEDGVNSEGMEGRQGRWVGVGSPSPLPVAGDAPKPWRVG